jgi:hypothetical protein
MTPTERVSDLLAITSRLIGCMEDEIALLRSMRTQDIGPLQPKKAGLAEAYEAHLGALRTSAEVEERIDSALVHELETATLRLQAAIADNLRAVRAAREVNDRVLKAVIASVEQDRPTAGYARPDRVSAAARRSAAPVSVTLDGRF